MPGEILPKGKMILREIAGDAEDGNGNHYELTTHIGDGSPLVRSKQTGKCFRLPWCDILAMAVEAGIDKEDRIKGSTES